MRLFTRSEKLISRSKNGDPGPPMHRDITVSIRDQQPHRSGSNDGPFTEKDLARLMALTGSSNIGSRTR